MAATATATGLLRSKAALSTVRSVLGGLVLLGLLGIVASVVSYRADVARNRHVWSLVNAQFTDDDAEALGADQIQSGPQRRPLALGQGAGNGWRHGGPIRLVI